MALTMLFLTAAFVLFLLIDWICENAAGRRAMQKLQADNASLAAQRDRSAAQAKRLQCEVKRLQNRLDGAQFLLTATGISASWSWRRSADGCASGWRFARRCRRWRNESAHPG